MLRYVTSKVSPDRLLDDAIHHGTTIHKETWECRRVLFHHIFVMSFNWLIKSKLLNHWICIIAIWWIYDHLTIGLKIGICLFFWLFFLIVFLFVWGTFSLGYTNLGMDTHNSNSLMFIQTMMIVCVKTTHQTGTRDRNYGFFFFDEIGGFFLIFFVINHIDWA